MSYAAVMLLAEEKPELLPLVVAAHQIAEQQATTSVLNRAPNIAPNLVRLRRRGIVTKTGETKQGHRGLYAITEPSGVARGCANSA